MSTSIETNSASEIDAARSGGKNGLSRSEGRSVQDYLAADVQLAPEIYRRESPAYLGSEDIDRTRYFSQEFHDLEVARLWSRVWQMACREEDIPDVGDHVVYDIADWSIIVVRTESGIKGFHNSCLHRGARLRDCDGSMQQIRCPFHAFTWDLEGELKSIPCEWDFPHVQADQFTLPQVKVGTWGGFVFVNIDLNAEPLESFLGGLPSHCVTWPFERRYKAIHVGKVVDCNWKVALEAFAESFHVVGTHPQALMYAGDANTQCDIFPDEANFNRMITLSAVPSPHIGDNVTEQEVLDALFDDYFKDRGLGVQAPSVPEGSTARRTASETFRMMLSGMTGTDLSQVSDCEMIDSLVYHLFPNLMPWPGVGNPIVYRFRPNGNDPNTSVFEIMVLFPYAEGSERPRGVPIHWLGPDEDWSDASELFGLEILMQDTANFSRVQRGLRASVKPGVTLGNYQEVRIRHFHQWLDAYLAG